MANENKTTKQIKEKISKYGLQFEQTTILEDRLNGHIKYKIDVLNQEFVIEIKFDSSREKYQCWLTARGKRMSLSFFPNPKNAKESAYQTITYMCGGQIQNDKPNGVGD